MGAGEDLVEGGGEEEGEEGCFVRCGGMVCRKGNYVRGVGCGEEEEEEKKEGMCATLHGTPGIRRGM